MREVKVFKWEQQQIDGKWVNVKVLDTAAWFHQFAQEADGEGQSNPVAIIERADGKVETVFAPMVQFLEPPVDADLIAALRTIAKHESSEGYIAMRALNAAGLQ